MDIPVKDTDALRIPNLHPDQRSSLHSREHDYGTIGDSGIRAGGEEICSSFSERLESFVGSYSRTSLMYMAENVAINPTDSLSVDEETGDALSIRTAASRCEISKYMIESESKEYHRNTSEDGTLHERSSLLFHSLDKVVTASTIATMADRASAVGKSSFFQSIFNSINILVGVGILSLPLGFKCAGWLIGSFIFLFSFGLTNYTAKLIARCMDTDPQARTYGDMSAIAFGFRGRVWVSSLFLLELITCSVALVVLLSDGILAFLPNLSPLAISIACFIILTPMVFLPIRHLSYTSLLGIFSAVTVVVVVVVDGFSKNEAPGSLWEPAVTELVPSNLGSVPMSFGLIMAGFAGHAVFPTIYTDMEKREQYKTMVNYTYLITAIIYVAVAVCGYLMFGLETMQEITQNLNSVPEYNQALNRLAIWIIALNPVAKYGLSMNPVNMSWQTALFKRPCVERWCAEASWRSWTLITLGKVFTSGVIVVFAYMVPQFDKVMSLLGAFFSFIISGIFPIVCHLRLFGPTLPRWELALSYLLIAIASSMAISGTIWSFL
ncbi:transmembrane amino acid transporter protein-domain-containing protein [Radiomyces spectabilis]|uniref:transmembrane amino acid transporter protein-domain-containing protein n=1 Tax=Radiomyces spectabilis TaxID=64574 RepID=UPI00221F8DDB|nr:transmembrane amino acid transporter protein-domain-containing protein [Radiomyces spectabilis]KAI8391743.1 transmembrane amino acid transporter protein-domain-containing protein [Radiomyces spectabilis]